MWETPGARSWRGSYAAGVCLVLGPASLTTVPVLVSRGLPLPDAPGRAQLQYICLKRHATERSAAFRLTAEAWQNVTAAMKQRGAQGTDEEFDAVRKYLTTNLLGEAAQPLNGNRATNVELESVGGLTRKEAAAVRAWVEKSGPCKKLEDLKKVAGLDYKKIEARKDFLICF